MRSFLTILLLFLSFTLNQGATVIQNAVLRNASVVGGSANDPVFNNVTHVWHLEEASGNARVDSKGSISLNETGGTVSQGTGKHNNCANFNTAAHWLSMSSDTTLNVSMALWVYVRTLPAVGKISIIFGEVAVPNSIDLWIDSSGNVNFQDDGIGGEDTTISTALGSLNVWHLIVCVSSTEDGNEYLSVDNSAFVSDAGQGHFIGDNFALSFCYVNAPANAPSVLDGQLDEITSFSVGLTQGNVTTLWNSGSGTWYSP